MEQLVSMVASPDGARRALAFSGATASEGAAQWLVAHLDDPELHSPALPPQPANNVANQSISNDTDVHMEVECESGLEKPPADGTSSVTDGDWLLHWV